MHVAPWAMEPLRYVLTLSLESTMMTEQHTMWMDRKQKWTDRKQKSPFALRNWPSKAAQLPKIPSKMAQHTRGRRCIHNYFGKQQSVGRPALGHTARSPVCHPSRRGVNSSTLALACAGCLSIAARPLRSSWCDELNLQLSQLRPFLPQVPLHAALVIGASRQMEPFLEKRIFLECLFKNDGTITSFPTAPRSTPSFTVTFSPSTFSSTSRLVRDPVRYVPSCSKFTTQRHVPRHVPWRAVACRDYFWKKIYFF